MFNKKISFGLLAVLALVGAVVANPIAQVMAKNSMHSTTTVQTTTHQKTMGCPFSMASGNIVQTAEKTAMFNTLIAALKATGLDKTLSDPNTKCTVFAPTDDAFKKLPTGTVENLLKPENKAQLVKILTYHVVAKPINAGNVLKMPMINTVEGDNLTISLKDGKPFVDNAQITKTDVYATNGIIHVVDSVLMPPAPTDMR